MGWLRLVGSIKICVSFAEYRLFRRSLLQKRPIILRSLLIVAIPYLSRRRSDLKYLDLQIYPIFGWIFWVTGTPCTQLKSLGDSRENVFDMYGDSCANLLEFLAVGARGKRRVFSPGAAHTESPQKTIFFTFWVEAQVPKQVAKPKKMCLGARRLTQLPRATRNSKFRRIFALYCVFGVPRGISIIFSRSLLCSGSCPFSSQQTRFFEKSADQLIYKFVHSPCGV